MTLELQRAGNRRAWALPLRAKGCSRWGHRGGAGGEGWVYTAFQGFPGGGQEGSRKVCSVHSGPLSPGNPSPRWLPPRCPWGVFSDPDPARGYRWLLRRMPTREAQPPEAEPIGQMAAQACMRATPPRWSARRPPPGRRGGGFINRARRPPPVVDKCQKPRATGGFRIARVDPPFSFRNAKSPGQVEDPTPAHLQNPDSGARVLCPTGGRGALRPLRGSGSVPEGGASLIVRPGPGAASPCQPRASSRGTRFRRARGSQAWRLPTTRRADVPVSASPEVTRGGLLAPPPGRRERRRWGGQRRAALLPAPSTSHPRRGRRRASWRSFGGLTGLSGAWSRAASPLASPCLAPHATLRGIGSTR